MKKLYLPFTRSAGLFLLWVVLLLNEAVIAQTIPDAQWARVGSTLAITTDGHIVTSAAIPGTGIPLTTPVGLKKYDLPGNLVWQAGPLAGASYIAGKLPPGFCPCVGGTAVIERIARTSPAPDGGIRFLGNEWGGAVIRSSVDATGHQTGSSYGSGFDALIATPDGGSLYVGTAIEYVGSGSESKTGVVVEKTGNPSWTTKIFYPNPDNPDLGLTKAAVAINTPDGGYLITGFYNSLGANSPGVPWVAKLDGNGTVSWQKLVSPPPLTNAPGPGNLNGMSTITDAIVSADGTGYALVGLGTTYPNNNATVLVEIDLSGNSRSGRAKAVDILQATNAFITPYTGSNGKKYYAVGNTTIQGRTDPQIRLVDPVSLNVVTNRVFPGPGASSLIDIATAGDGSLIFVTDNNQLVKLNPEPVFPTGGPLVLTQPTYNCQMGAITFNTTGGDGSPITYTAPGISRSSATSNTGIVEQGLRNDPKPITITAMQSGNTVSYVFDFGAFCNNPTNPNPPITPPTGGSLALLAPTYSCATGAITFNTAGGNGSTIEYAAAGITSWTTNPNQFVDKDSRTANDVQPFTLMARQSGVTVTYVWDLRAFCNNPTTPPTNPNPPVTPPTGGSLALVAPGYNCATGAITFNTAGGNGTTIEYAAAGITGWTTNPNQFVDQDSRTASDVQPFTLMARQNGVTVTYVWDLKAACGRLARLGAEEPGTTLQVQVLGNPMEGRTAEVEIKGAAGQDLLLNLTDSRGASINQQRIRQAESTERVSIPIGSAPGILLLRVSTAVESKTVKLLKP